MRLSGGTIWVLQVSVSVAGWLGASMEPFECGACVWGEQEKIETIARETYGAASVEYLPQAEKQIELYTRMGFSGLPICMAKTQYSFSADAAVKVNDPFGLQVGSFVFTQGQPHKVVLLLLTSKVPFS